MTFRTFLTLNIYDLALSNHNSPPQGACIARQIFNKIEPSSRLAILAFGRIFRYGSLMESMEHSTHAKPRRCFGRSRVNDTRYAGIVEYGTICNPFTVFRFY